LASVTDNEWFAFLAQQPLLPKTPRQNNVGQARHSAIKTADKSATQPAGKKDGG